MANKKPPELSRSEIINFRLTPELFRRVKEAAAKDRRTVSEWVRIAVEDKL